MSSGSEDEKEDYDWPNLHLPHPPPGSISDEALATLQALKTRWNKQDDILKRIEWVRSTAYLVGCQKRSGLVARGKEHLISNIERIYTNEAPTLREISEGGNQMFQTVDTLFADPKEREDNTIGMIKQLRELVQSFPGEAVQKLKNELGRYLEDDSLFDGIRNALGAPYTAAEIEAWGLAKFRD